MSSPSRVGSIDPTTFGLVPFHDILSSSQGYVHVKLAYMGVTIIIIITLGKPLPSLFFLLYTAGSISVWDLDILAPVFISFLV